tara:strand:+ start:743 stop:1402 length:660 start_codon:yes stop_codon:yes gene_type:complete
MNIDTEYNTSSLGPGKMGRRIPPNLGWLEYRLTVEEYNYIWKCIENKKESHGHKLAGNIDSSYVLEDIDNWLFNKLLSPLEAEYEKSFSSLGKRVPINKYSPYYMERWWVNYQRQNEFNPLHDHSGIYSFVIWMKIPTSYEEQNLNNPSNTKRISSVDFYFTDTLGHPMNYSYELSPEMEGIMLFFPATLQHQVYPFYNCDDVRISVSGNLSLDVTKEL